MRQANQGVTEGYTHAELVEMYAAIVKVPAVVTRVATVATGIHGQASNASANSCESQDHRQDQAAVPPGRAMSLEVTDSGDGKRAESARKHWAKSHSVCSRRVNSRRDLSERATPDILLKTGPSTQVD